jgi:alkanesulfonate monooxygenase SsuD/methylene tetrahydromethanopterin reductase-like flavin-dependent oxidoreductase (luciferase family)
MAHQLRFGVTHPQFAWPTLVEHAQHLEQLGFDSIWLIDHIVPFVDPSQPLLEAWTALAGLAAHTRRIRLGILTTNVLFRNPVLLAKQAVTVDHISNGRVELALGSGNAGPSYPMLGLDAGTRDERIERLREVVAIVHRLLRSESVTFQGRYYATRGAVLRPAALQQPCVPLTIGAHRKAALKVVAEYADRWNTFGGFGLTSEQAFAITRERNAQLDHYCTECGREPRELVRSFLVGFTQDKPLASLDAFQDFVGRYREIGISEFILRWPPQGAELDTLQRAARELLPSLRA